MQDETLANQLVLAEDRRLIDKRLIRIGEAMKLTGLSRTSLYSLSAQGLFPRSVPLVPGGTSRAWVRSEILAWVEQRIAERDQEFSNA